MSATSSPTIKSSSRRMIGAALGYVLVVAAAPFLRSASAAQPTGNPAAMAETDAVTGAEAADPAVWTNSTDATKSLILGANDTRLVTYDMAGKIVTQADVPSGTTAGAVTGVDVRHNVSIASQAIGDVAAVVGNGTIRFYLIDQSGKLTDKTANPAGITPEWPSSGGKFGGVCMYQSPVTSKTYAFVFAPSGQIEQLELIDNAGKIDVQIVRGGKTAEWDLSPGVSSAPGGCVVDDEMKTLYMAEKTKGIWKFGAEPTDSITAGTLIDTPAPSGHLMVDTKGLALVETGAGAGYLMASTFDHSAPALTDSSVNVYDRAAGNAYIRTFNLVTGPGGDNCQESDGIDAAAGNFGVNFPNGMFLCQDKINRVGISGGGDDPNNYKMFRLEQAVDMTAPVVTTTTTAPITTPTTAPPVQVPNTRSGYWMVGSDGKVFEFGDAKHFGNITLAAGAQAIDLEPTPSGNGYWVIDDLGHVFAKGDAKMLGDVDQSLLTKIEIVTSLSATSTGNGYWAFTNLGRVIPFGDAVHYGDMSKVKLNGPVLDSIPSSSGKGYFMVASDGGIFSFGDATFKGSMGGKPLNKPVQSLVPDADGVGYWLVASDGGIFAFDAQFRGSMGGKPLNKPVTGMVRYGNGYLMVGEDGGIFSFSDKKFVGSLGDNPPLRPITSVAVLDAP
jgi:myo-inositol-hexaphosphate 3-phosphohydrolase